MRQSAPLYEQRSTTRFSDNRQDSALPCFAPFDNTLPMEDKTDLVDTYFSAMANTPLKALIFFVVLALGAAIPGWLGGIGGFPAFVMWPLTVFGALFTWESAMPLFGIAYLCLFGCLYNYLISEQTLRPLFYGFSICYWCCLRLAGDLLWLAVLIYAIALAAFLFAPFFKRIRTYEKTTM